MRAAERAHNVSQVYKVVKGSPYGELQLMVAARKQGRTSAMRTAIQNHRKTWVTEGHFAYMAEYGINAVRIGVGHWVMASTTWQVRRAVRVHDVPPQRQCSRRATPC